MPNSLNDVFLSKGTCKLNLEDSEGYGYLGHLRVGKCPSYGWQVCTSYVATSLLPVEYATMAARLIYEELGQPILAMSSGIDSQAAFFSFLQAKVPFSVAIMRFRNELNQFDIEFAIELCRRSQVDFKIFELDALDFFVRRRMHIEYHERYRVHLPELASHLWLAQQVGDGIVFSGNPPSIAKSGGANRVNMPSEAFFCYDRFYKQNAQKGVGHFFLYTPELINSFLVTPTIRSMRENHSLSYDYSSKVQTYLDGGFPVTPQIKKFHGFELIEQNYMDRHKRSLHDELFSQILAVDDSAINENCDFASKNYIWTPLVLDRCLV